VTLHVSDGTVGVDQTFTIDVGNTNDGPSFTSTPVTSATQDALYTYTITADDPDEGDMLSITAPTLPAWLGLTDNQDGTDTLIGTPTNSQVGDHAVVLQVTDGIETASQSFTITVANVNDAPVLAQPADQTNAKGTVISLQLLATDVDAGDTLTYSAEGLPGGLSIDPASGLISGTITGDAGPYTVIAGVDDGHGGTDSKTFNWTVTETITYTLTMAVDPEDGGTTNPSVGTNTYPSGTVVALTYQPTSGYTFSSWSGDADCADGSVTMNADKACTANYTENLILLPGIADDSDALWSYSGDWNSYNGAGPYLDTVHYSGTIGDSAQIAISGGQQIKLTYIMGSNRGVTDVFIDDVKVASIDAYSTAFGWQVTWTSGVLTNGLHTVRFVHASGAYTDIDAIELFATLPTSLLPGMADDIDLLWSYSGDWTAYHGVGPYSNTLHYSSSIGDSAQIMVSGSQQVKLTYVTSFNRGNIDVYIDGVKVTSIDAYSTTPSWQKTWASDLLSTGLHTVRLVHASGTHIDIDSIGAVATFVPHPIVLPGTSDDNDAMWSYHGDWWVYNGGGPYLDTLHYSITVGDWAQTVISGSQQIKLTYVTGFNRGVTDVYIDDAKVGSIDSYSPTFIMQATWTSGVLTTGPHTLRLVHVSGSVTDIDAIEGIAVFATPSVHPGIVDDVNSLWSYSGDWAIYGGGGPYLSSLHYSLTIGDSAQIAIVGGQQIKLTYVTGPNRGVMDIYVDDVKIGSIDTYSSYFIMQATWTSGVLTTGPHTVRLVHASGDITDIDALEVIP
jgi:hypothetical protein